MSDILRITAGPKVRAATFRTLAELAHQAEETDDDVLLLEVADEVERRERSFPGYTRLFRETYLEIWPARRESKKGKKKK